LYVWGTDYRACGDEESVLSVLRTFDNVLDC
jgi:hypothetical protein